VYGEPSEARHSALRARWWQVRAASLAGLPVHGAIGKSGGAQGNHACARDAVMERAAVGVEESR
jgi:hypothetical protein